jgi:hypothetical protein
MVGVQVRDEDPTRPVLQVLFLAGIKKQTIIDQHSGMVDMSGRRHVNISTRSKDS